MNLFVPNMRPKFGRGEGGGGGGGGGSAKVGTMSQLWDFFFLWLPIGNPSKTFFFKYGIFHTRLNNFFKIVLL